MSIKVKWLAKNHITNESWNQYLEFKNNCLSAMSHQLVLYSFSKGIGDLQVYEFNGR